MLEIRLKDYLHYGKVRVENLIGSPLKLSYQKLMPLQYFVYQQLPNGGIYVIKDTYGYCSKGTILFTEY